MIQSRRSPVTPLNLHFKRTSKISSDPSFSFGVTSGRHFQNWRDDPLARASRNQLLPGARYNFAALEALSATALNSLPVQALEVDTSEIVPAAAVAINAAMMDSASLASVMSRKSELPVVK
jgi:hypothetical protein